VVPRKREAYRESGARVKRTGHLLVVLLAAMTAWGVPARATVIPETWPDGEALQGVRGESITFPTRSPFTPGATKDHPLGSAKGLGTLFMPKNASPTNKVPAVVMLHGSAGVIGAREYTYGQQFAAMGFAALVIDSFGARRDRATDFIGRLMEITETMLVADAYAGLEYLAKRGDVDAARVALAGFSYGGMATTFAAYRQIAETLGINGGRFAGHVAFYGPCIARFTDSRTTAAPLLFLSGSADAIVDPERCEEIAGDLRKGGSSVEIVVYPGAYHQWDGARSGPRNIGRNLAPCRFLVEPDGTVVDRQTPFTMNGPFTRKLILGLCTNSEGYLIGRDDEVRARSNRDFGRFLRHVFRL